MTYQLLISQEAQIDIEEAVDWYQLKAPHLGNEFLNCLGQGFSRIQRNPLLFPEEYKTYRKMLIRRFPFQIIYTIDESIILVLAVFHVKRNPDIWKNR